MPIKQSTLEEKWCYRVAKTSLYFLPWVAVYIRLRGMGLTDITIWQKNGTHILDGKAGDITGIIVGIIAYYVLLNLLWRLVLYLVFGGLEKDAKAKAAASPLPNAQAVETASQKGNRQLALIIGFFILIGFILFAADAYNKSKLPYNSNINNNKKTIINNSDPNKKIDNNTGNNTNNTDNKTQKCIPTGCGIGWYCSGYYYFDGVQIRINGCLPNKANEIYSGWSGTCRQCP